MTAQEHLALYQRLLVLYAGLGGCSLIVAVAWLWGQWDERARVSYQALGALGFRSGATALACAVVIVWAWLPLAALYAAGQGSMAVGRWRMRQKAEARVQLPSLSREEHRELVMALLDHGFETALEGESELWEADDGRRLIARALDASERFQITLHRMSPEPLCAVADFDEARRFAEGAASRDELAPEPPLRAMTREEWAAQQTESSSVAAPHFQTQVIGSQTPVESYLSIEKIRQLMWERLSPAEREHALRLQGAPVVAQAADG